MAKIELEIKNPKDRMDVGAILLDNGYCVWTAKVKKGTRSTQTTVLCAEKAETGKAVQA